MGAADDIADGLEEIEGDITSDGTALTFAWPATGTTTYPCTAGTGTFGKTLGEGGFNLNANREIVVRTSLFANGDGPFPDLKQKVKFDGYTYTIDDIDKPPGNTFLVLKLIDPAKGI